MCGLSIELFVFFADVLWGNKMLSRIKTLCEENDMSLTSLERELGFGKSTIRKWDKNAPSIDKVLLIADYFDVSMDYIIGRTPLRNATVAPDADELEFLETYERAKQSDKSAVKTALKLIDKLLGEDE
jgi:transcriptional regulator with XRE-family HTH domain